MPRSRRSSAPASPPRAPACTVPSPSSGRPAMRSDPTVVAELEELERALAGEPSPFTELVADVRAQRPQMDPAFAARLDARVDAARKAPPRRSWPVWSPAAGLVAAVVVAVVLVSGGDSTDNSASSGSSSAGSSAAQSAPADRSAKSAGGSSTELAAPAQPQALSPGGRRV